MNRTSTLGKTWRWIFPLAALFLARCTCGDPNAVPCETAIDCNGDRVCDPASSTCLELACSMDAECGDSASCIDSECVADVVAPSCTDDVDCPGDQQCRNGNCREQRPVDSPCTSAEECAEPLVCAPSNQRCTDDVPCTEHDDCGTAAYCDGSVTDPGECVPAEPESVCLEDDQCIEGQRCVGVVCIPDECEGTAFSAEPVPANVMVTIDRSGSMNDNLGNEGSKWDVGRAAITDLLATASPAISFGLNPYPGFDQECDDGQNCGPGVVALDLGAPREDIVAYLEGADTCSFRTPTAENLELLVDEVSLKDPARNNFVLLITDGQSTCDDPVDAVEDLFNANPPVRTFVVGFGDGVDPDELEDMAVAGGTARQGNPAYYQADDADSLAAAFAEITGSVLGCDYSIDVSPDEDPTQMGVFFNGQLVPRDPTGATGWDVNFAAGRISFAGNACVALQTGLVTDLTLVYGCPVVVDPDPDPVPDAGVIDPVPDAGPDGCTDVCGGDCAGEACLLDPGESVGSCGECRDDGDCCPGSLCLPDGSCISIGG